MPNPPNSDNKPDHQPVTRRDFAKRAAAAAAAPIAAVVAETIVVAGIVGDGTAAAAEGADDAKPAPVRPPHELYVDLIRQQFPHEKLTAETLDLVRADIAGDLGRYRALDKYPLRNSDEPGFAFRAWRADG